MYTWREGFEEPELRAAGKRLGELPNGVLRHELPLPKVE